MRHQRARGSGATKGRRQALKKLGQAKTAGVIVDAGGG